MGLYSSWASFTLCHHALVHYTAWLEHLQFPFRKYSMLGDDNSIWNKGVSERYLHFIRMLDVDISLGKSFIPTSEGPCVAEFAKRISDKGDEISALSPNMIVSGTSFWAIPSIIQWLKGHNFLQMETIPFSEIAQYAGDLRLKPLYPNQYSNLAFLFHIINIMGRSNLTVEFSAYDIKESLLKIKPRFILLMRVKLLMNQANKLKASYEEFRTYLRAQLRSLDLGTKTEEELVQSHYFYAILRSRFEATRKQIYLLDDLIDQLYESETAMKEMQLEIPGLSELEYMPITSFNSIYNELKSSSIEKKTMRWRYIQDLSDTIIKIDQHVSKGVPLRNIEESLKSIVKRALASAYMQF
jgi:hypothetical protein